jgi:hypothetical protein
MPNKRYIAGRRFEYSVKKQLEKEGYFVIRASASKGLFDLIAFKKEHISPANPNDFCLRIKFLQLKKNINEKEAINLLQKIEQQIFGENIKMSIIHAKNTKYFSLFGEGYAVPYKGKIFVDVSFEVIYTPPQKKKLEKRKRRIIKVGKTLKGGEKVAEAASG